MDMMKRPNRNRRGRAVMCKLKHSNESQTFANDVARYLMIAFELGEGDVVTACLQARSDAMAATIDR